MYIEFAAVLSNTENQNNGCVDNPHLLILMQDSPLVAIVILKVSDVDLSIEISISQVLSRKCEGIYQIQVLPKILKIKTKGRPGLVDPLAFYLVRCT